MLKESIIENVIGQLNNVPGVKYLIRPQSMMVVDNPDIIVTYGNNIYGLYIPSQNEVKDIDSFLRRIYLSRLVYAHDMRIILLTDSYELLEKSPFIKYAIHQLAIGKEIDNLSKMIVGDHSRIQNKMLSREVRSHAASNYYLYSDVYENTMQFSEVYDFFNPGNNWHEITPTRRWSNMRFERSVKESFQCNETVIINKSQKRKVSLKQALNDVLTYGLFSKYSWDDGQLYISDDYPPVRFLNTDLLVALRNNHIMLSTMACLGIIPAAFASKEQLDRAAVESIKIMEEYHGK